MNTPNKSASPLIAWFAELSLDDVGRVGGKNASLGELFRQLTPMGVRIPDGFALTAQAYRDFIKSGNLEPVLRAELTDLDVTDVPQLRLRGRRVREAILQTPLPEALVVALNDAYRTLSDAAGTAEVDVAVRSSATAEDLPEASFAGQQETYLNVRGETALGFAVRRCMASLFTDRAISYRRAHGFDDFSVALSVGIQRMVRSDLASAGVMFSIDTESGFDDVVLINGAWGLGENVVQGAVNPDEFYVFKPTLKTGFRPIVQKTLGRKEICMVYDEGGEKQVKNIPVSSARRAEFVLTDDELLTLARWAILIEDHYSAFHKKRTPMDMEWAKDGRSGELFIVQARPETVVSQRKKGTIDRWTLSERSEVLVEGRAVGHRIGVGPVQVIHNASDIESFVPGSILVTDMTDPDWEPVMKTAAAIVTNRGGRTCHAAIVSRELGLAAIVGADGATEALAALGEDPVVTVSCADGDTGVVFRGALPFVHDELDVGELRRPQTQIMMNLADPAQAFSAALLPSDGVGLVREEFIIMHHIGIHPMALLRFDDLEDQAAKKEIARRTRGYTDKTAFFVDKLAQGLGTIAAAFYPRDVIVRLSDFKTNEYAHLLGGEAFEPKEENPMIGFRGASRYYDERYREGFALECAALKRVRDDMGLTNVKVMIPFCRTVEEGRRVQAEMAKGGLVRGENGLEIYVMCEVPSNVICADAFAELFDGFSIGSNDLTQLTLGVDRDSGLLAHLFDERDPAVKQMLKMAIDAAKAAGRKIGICGQAPSDHPEIARFLVEHGIDSLSLTPDVIVQTTIDIVALEDERAAAGR